MNQSYASQLEAGLAAELAALENFVDLTVQERQVLRRDDPVELDRIVRGKARHLADISLIEARANALSSGTQKAHPPAACATYRTGCHFWMSRPVRGWVACATPSCATWSACAKSTMAIGP